MRYRLKSLAYDRVNRGKDRLDFENFIRPVNQREAQAALKGPGTVYGVVQLKFSQLLVGGAGEVFHHDVALDSASFLVVAGVGKTDLLVMKHRRPVVPVRKRQDQGGRAGSGGNPANSVDVADDGGSVGDRWDVTPGLSRVKTWLDKFVVHNLPKGLAAIGGLGLLVAGRDTVESDVVELVLLIAMVHLILELSKLDIHLTRLFFKGLHLGLEGRDLGQADLQKFFGLLDVSRLLLHVRGLLPKDFKHFLKITHIG